MKKLTSINHIYNVVRCKECTLLQIDYVVDRESLSSIILILNYTVNNEQKELAKYLNEKFQLSKKSCG